MSRVKSYQIELVETTNMKTMYDIIYDMCNSLSKPYLFVKYNGIIIYETLWYTMNADNSFWLLLSFSMGYHLFIAYDFCNIHHLDMASTTES